MRACVWACGRACGRAGGINTAAVYVARAVHDVYVGGGLCIHIAEGLVAAACQSSALVLVN